MPLFRAESALILRHLAPNKWYNYPLTPEIITTHEKEMRILNAAVLTLCLAVFLSAPFSEGTTARAETPERIAAGNEIAFRRSGEAGVGNCLACHAIAGGESPGTMGPPLVAIKPRFPDREVLRRQVFDATEFNPISAMPPFGKHGILTEEIELVLDFLYTL